MRHAEGKAHDRPGGPSAEPDGFAPEAGDMNVLADAIRRAGTTNCRKSSRISDIGSPRTGGDCGSCERS